MDPRKVIYRTGLFDPSNLTTQSEIDTALFEFGAVINQGNYVEVLKDLFQKKYIVVLILSGIHEEIPLNQWILDDFPPNPDNSENSFAYVLLRELSSFLLFYSPSANAKTGSFLRDRYYDVQNRSGILDTLLNMSFVEDENDGKFPPPSPTKRRAKGTQREQKQGRKLARRSLSIDHKPFTALGLTVPKNRHEADSLCEGVWLQMGSILDVLLNGIRHPDVVDFIRALFIPREGLEEHTVPPQSAITVEELVSPTSAPIVAEAGPLYPTVQSMREAFHFEPPDNFGKWKILVPQGVLPSWERRDRKVYLIVRKKLEELSYGFFSNDNQKRLCGPTTDVPVFEAKMTGDLRLVYSVDCIDNDDKQSEIQALRVFGIFTHSQMKYRLWECVSKFLSSRSKEYCKRCRARQLHPGGGNIYLPQSFPESSQAEEPGEFSPDLPADEVNHLHQVVSLEKYVMLSKALLESIDSRKDANFPFEVSKHERTIIEYPRSCYVLGRSGTGKTTSMLFKMLIIERAYQLSEEPRQRPRQMFVTKSRTLATKVDELFTTYFSSLSIASHADELFLRRNMNMLSNNVFNEDDEADYQRGDLPAKFSELEDRHFPLFISFTCLCTMIEADIQATLSTKSVDSSEESLIELFGKTRSSTRKGKLVTFDRFIAEYWPRLDHSPFHALLIFNEIIGVIAGSEGALFSPNGYLDRDTYINLSSRMYPVFADHRDTTYNMFMIYLKRKKELDDYDFADRTHTIIRSMATKSFALKKVSHLYVDETQDQLLIDVYLLRLLCGNSDGLFWAGDTAQTISAGSSFRFNDLKAFLYRLQKTRPNQELIRLREPRMFYLSLNYRSHAGIVNCAHSIVEIIKKYWNNSIDPLPRERGNAHGAMPIFYTDMYPEFVRECHFASRDRIMGEQIALGADQCILVRDKKAKEKLKNEVGNKMFRKLGIVATLYQCKGLEFNDVLLYNFFHDSLADNAWRLILNDVGTSQSRITAPKFDETRHATICSELKSLYVAVTRARNNLRIADESFIGEPMRALWESRGQILSCRPGEESTDFGKPSNKKGWANRGRLFFDNCQWELAKDCYERAGMRQEARVADSYLARQRARRIPSEGRGEERNNAFKFAAKSFESCAQNANDSDVLSNKYLKLAAGCWEEGNNEPRAAEVYQQGDCISDASRVYRKLEKFDEIYNILTKSPLAGAVPRSIRDETCVHFFSKKAYKKTRNLFDSHDQELNFLEQHRLDDSQVGFLVFYDRIREAADFCVSLGWMLKAVYLYLEDTTNVSESTSKAKGVILTSLWQLSPFGVKRVERDKIHVFLDLANKVEDAMDQNDIDEITMFRAILNGALTELAGLARTFLKRGNQHAALLSYDRYFERLPSLADKDIEEIIFELHQFSDYVRTLRKFIDNPAGNPLARQLFGFRFAEERDKIVLLTHNTLGLKGNHELTREEFLTALRRCLKDRLEDRVIKENDTCLTSPAMNAPCSRQIIFKKCNLSGCDYSHISPDFVWFQHLIQAHLLQIVIYDSISKIQRTTDFCSQQRFSLVKLYEVLCPASHEFGPTSNVMKTAVVASPMAVDVLTDWVRVVSLDLDFEPESQFLTFAMQTLDFGFAYDRTEAERYIPRKFDTLSCPEGFYTNLLQGMLTSWNQKDSSSIWMGILFICHVVEKKIPVNIHVFWSYIERICTHLIICVFFQRNGSLRSIMLPRTWLRASLDSIDKEEAKSQNTTHFWQLLEPLEKLIHILYFPPARGNSQFHLGPRFRTVAMQGFLIRSLFIARICRVLGLLGTNIPDLGFQTEILNIFTSIHQEVAHHELDPKISRLHIGYFTAGTFRDVYLATRRSMRGAVFDEMVRLLWPEQLDTTRPQRPQRELSDQRDIVYSTHGELATLLDAIEDSILLHSKATSSSQQDGPLGDVIDKHSDDQACSKMDKTAPESHELLPDREIIEGVYVDHSEQVKAQAAAVIQHAWRKREMMKEGGARRWFELYRKALLPGMRSGHPRSMPPYSIYFLGPLPTMQAALDSIQTVLHKSKGALGGNHEDLEQVGLNITRIDKATKDLKRHQAQLGPNSDLHSACNIEQLKTQLEEVFDVINDIRPLVKIPDDLHATFEIVYKAVLLKHHPQILGPQLEKRSPELVMEDLDELIQDAHEGL